MADAVINERDRLAANAGLRRAYEAAIAGRTGLEGSDDWAIELVDTGWLHNHALIWFASIRIFTLRLPWVLGADFFLQHLLDGDPANNTPSWRWVAGLHTRGKAYAARAENIRRYTAGRFSPTGLNESPAPLDEADPPQPIPLPRADPAPSGDVALLLHLDDLHPESLPLGKACVVRVGGVLAHAQNAVERVRRADEQAMNDALTRAQAQFGCDAGPVEHGWAGGLAVATAWAPVGSVGRCIAGRLRAGRAALGRSHLATVDARILPAESSNPCNLSGSIDPLTPRPSLPHFSITPTRRQITLLLVSGSIPARAQAPEDLLQVLRLPGSIGLLRHANAPGVGDPPGFRLDACATQRNLDAAGREQAHQCGARLREAGVRASVFSSAWCRTRETAELLDMGRVQILPALNSFFGNGREEAEQTAAVQRFVRAHDQETLILVTHQVNITALTGVYPGAAEMVVMRPGTDGHVVAGHLTLALG